MLDGDSDSAIQGFYDLLGDANIEKAVRKGDIFATIIEYYAENKSFKSAMATIQEMKNTLQKVSRGLLRKYGFIKWEFLSFIFFFFSDLDEIMYIHWIVSYVALLAI